MNGGWAVVGYAVVGFIGHSVRCLFSERYFLQSGQLRLMGNCRIPINKFLYEKI